MNNLAIIECKKSSNRSNNERKYDKLKLIHYQSSEFLNYQYGIFIDFIVGENFDFKIERIKAD